MLEIEMKFPVETFDAVRTQLQRMQATLQPTIDEADHYFNAPDRDFGKTDEAFRLRCFAILPSPSGRGAGGEGAGLVNTSPPTPLPGGEGSKMSNRITYKGPKQGGLTKTRTEIEIAIESGPDAAEQFRRLVQHLGYRPTAVVKKRRTCYDFQCAGFALQACCDEVETLGRFVEVEIVTQPPLRDQAQTVLLQVAQELGLHKSEPRSYLEMVLAKQSM